MKSSKLNLFSKIIKCICISILAVLLILNVFIIAQSKIFPNSVPSIFGYKPFIVLSGSMKSVFNVGDLVIVKKADVNTLKVGDIIAFRGSDNLVTTHRIVNIVKQNNDICFQTKGDNNNVEDKNLVCSKNIEGKYKSKIAKLGSVILFLQQPLGFTIVIMSIFIIYMFMYLLENRKINKEELKEFEEFKREKTLKQKEK